MSRKKLRILSSEERALWDKVKATARPLRALDAKRGETPIKATPADRQPLADAAKNPEQLAVFTKTASSVAVQFKAVSSGLDRARLEKLRRGKLQPEARLDLHGMTVDRAHSALAHFIHRTSADGLRLVLIITGKGAPSEFWHQGDGKYGILRESVPRWLSVPSLSRMILATCPAHRRHGGDGALYVYLRRHM